MKGCINTLILNKELILGKGLCKKVTPRHDWHVTGFERFGNQVALHQYIFCFFVTKRSSELLVPRRDSLRKPPWSAGRSGQMVVAEVGAVDVDIHWFATHGLITLRGKVRHFEGPPLPYWHRA